MAERMKKSMAKWGALALMSSILITTGVGVWGNNHPVMWGWDIINFVWWIGIGHAGTLISAMFSGKKHLPRRPEDE